MLKLAVTVMRYVEQAASYVGGNEIFCLAVLVLFATVFKCIMNFKKGEILFCLACPLSFIFLKHPYQGYIAAFDPYLVMALSWIGILIAYIAIQVLDNFIKTINPFGKSRVAKIALFCLLGFTFIFCKDSGLVMQYMPAGVSKNMVLAALVAVPMLLSLWRSVRIFVPLAFWGSVSVVALLTLNAGSIGSPIKMNGLKLSKLTANAEKKVKNSSMGQVLDAVSFNGILDKIGDAKNPQRKRR